LVGEKVALATQEALLDIRKHCPEVTSKLIGASIRNGAQVKFLAGLDVLTIPPAAMEQFLSSENSGFIGSNIGKEIQPGIDSNHSMASRFPKLWEVPESFRQFVDDLLAEGNLACMTGEELEAFCRKQSIDLFHSFSADNLKKIIDQGKIPLLKDWPEKIALDDLMTQSALQSFSKDQGALDDRIRSFL